MKLPIFGQAKGLPFPRFDLVLKEGESKEAFVEEVEEGERQIVGKISDKEYLTRKVAGGMMPWLNHVLEELGIRHDEHVVPPEVLTSNEGKKNKKKAMAAAESRKRRGGGTPKVAAKRVKITTTSPASAESSASASGSTAEASAADSGSGVVEPMMGMETKVVSMASVHDTPVLEVPGAAAAAGVTEVTAPEVEAALVAPAVGATEAQQTGLALGLRPLRARRRLGSPLPLVARWLLHVRQPPL